MVFSDALTKAGRLVELQHIFWRNPRRVLATRELAERVGAAPRTVRKYLTELSSTGRLPIIRERRGWQLAREARLETLPVRFQLEQAAALFLAARLLLASADEPNQAVREALARLASVLPAEVRPFVDRLASRHTAPDTAFASIFRTVSYGWALRRAVSLEYHARSHPGESHTIELEPYLLDASAVGRAIYVIGRALPPGEVRVLKLERIRSAALTERTFDAPPVEDLLTRLEGAWGVWLSADPPLEVQLRFDEAVADRVRETRWHATQQLAPRGDGSVVMTLKVASTVEILPWLLGWGRHCEVLEPPELRRQVAEELAAASARYADEAAVKAARAGGP